MRIAAALTLALSCTLAAVPAAADTALNVLYAWPGHKPFHEALAEAFTAKEPDIRVEYRAPAQNYDEALQMLTRQKIAGDLPDVHYAGYNMLRELATRELIQPLNDLLSGQDMEALGYAPNVLELGKVDGVQYGLPFAMSTPIVFVNADLVERAGGNPKNIPQDWNDFIALSAKIDALGDDISGMYYELGSDDWTTQNLIRNFGGRMMDETGSKIAFDGAEGHEAVNLYKRFFAEAGQPNVEQRAARQMFTAGQLGFYFASPSGISGFEKEIGDRFELATAPLPLGSPDATMPTGGMAAVILTDDPERREAAWNFIRFGTGPEGQDIVVRRTGYMPTNTLALGNDYLGGFYESHPNWKTSVAQLERARPWFAWPGSNGVRIGQVIRENMEAIAYERKEPEQALDDMAETVRSLLPPAN